MKAIRIHAYGGPELMHLDDAPVPACGVGDLLVRVVAAGVNPIDWKMRSGAMAAQLPKPFPITLGSDAAGIVTALGEAVRGFEVGDEVFFYAEFTRGGTYAEYVAVDASQVAKKPRTVSFSTAAALPIPGQAAWTALIETAKVERGQRVLIHGGAGALGGATQEASWATMRKGGILVATALPPSPERAAAAGVRAAFVFTPPRGAVLAQLAQRVDDGRLRVVVGQELALADAAQAHRLRESGKARGKMILQVAAPAG